MNDDSSDATQYEMFLRLRNAGDTATLAVSIGQDAPQTVGDPVALASDGVMLSGDDSTGDAPAFVAPAGTYILQLIVEAGGVNTCAGSLPDFGYDNESAMSYMLLGNG
jgi:hypothetical protein